MHRLNIGFIFTTCLACLLISDSWAADVSSTGRKTVLVTGASSGIGRQIALTLAENGFFVFAGARKAGDIAELSELENIQGVRLDVTIQSDIDAAVETVQQHGQGLFGLVNNAGVFIYDPLIEVSEKDMRFVLDVNVLGPYRVTKAFAPLLMESKGRISTIGSISGVTSGRLMGPYGMSKHAIESFTDSLAAEMAKLDVAVSVIEPGNFRSDIMKNMKQRSDDQSSDAPESLFDAEISRFAGFTQTDRSRHLAPTPVALATLDFLSAEQPKRRYLVAPNAREAEFAIRSALKRVAELNHDQPYSQSREALITTLDELMTELSSNSHAEKQ
ncbi:MAG: SDR family NAD(P)-dependent oxidoreductase [Pseudomonadota bacterium]